MASELNVLAHALERIAESNRRSRDFTLDSLRDAITEVVACFPVYRTYVDEQGWTPEDRAVVERAIARARRRNPAMESSLFDFFREVMLPREPRRGRRRRPSIAADGYPPADADEARERLRFAMKFQQYTGPVQAKGLEDTAFFRYNLLLSLNEVGGDPSSASAARSRSSTRRMPRRLRELAVRDARDRHARHQARRRRARAHQRALGDARRVGARGRAVDAAEPGAPHARRRRAGARPQRRVPVLPGAGRHLAGRPAATTPSAGARRELVERLSGLHAEGGRRKPSCTRAG